MNHRLPCQKYNEESLLMVELAGSVAFKDDRVYYLEIN